MSILTQTGPVEAVLQEGLVASDRDVLFGHLVSQHGGHVAVTQIRDSFAAIGDPAVRDGGGDVVEQMTRHGVLLCVDDTATLTVLNSSSLARSGGRSVLRRLLSVSFSAQPVWAQLTTIPTIGSHVY
jgi:hypothetical protein